MQAFVASEKSQRSQNIINELPSQEQTESSYQNGNKKEEKITVNEIEISDNLPQKKINGYVKAIKYRDDIHKKTLKPVFSAKRHINLKPTTKEGEDHIFVHVTLELYKAKLHWTVKDLNTGKIHYFDVRFKLFEDPEPEKYAQEINELCANLLSVMYLDDENLIKFNDVNGTIFSSI